MSTNKLVEINRLGQSLWYDNMDRALLNDGSIARMISTGEIVGITSNPSIFAASIGKGAAYDAEIRAIVSETPSISDSALYERLAIADIQNACDLLRPVYERTDGIDGFASIEVSPLLAYDTTGTIEEAHRLHRAVNRKNVMIKVPATAEGFPAIQTLLTEGIPVNITLIFSREDYATVAERYLAALEARAAKALPLRPIASVASFFVSRLDSKLDKLLPENSPLRGQVAVTYSRLVYADFERIFSTDRFRRLQENGARVQRPLWGSTGTKNPAYSDVLYVEELIAPTSVNTVPPATLAAARDHARASIRIREGIREAESLIRQCEAIVGPISKLTGELKTEGVNLFKESFETLMSALKKKRSEVQ